MLPVRYRSPFAAASRHALRLAAASCCTAILLLTALTASAQEDEPPAPPVVNPNIRGTIEDKTYAATPPQGIRAQGYVASDYSKAFDRVSRSAGVSTTFGEFQPVFSAFTTRGSLRSATEYGIQVTVAGETPGIGTSWSYSPSLSDFVRKGLNASSAIDGLAERSPAEQTNLLANAIANHYISYLKNTRLRVGVNAQWFPDALVFTSGMLNANQYLDRETRQVQIHVDGALSYFDIENGDSLWAGRWTVGASWHDVPAQYDNEGKFQRWQVQVGADVTPNNSVDLGTSWSAFLRYRPKRQNAQAAACDAQPFGSSGPEYSFRIGQIPGERFRPGSSARDFMQLRAQWPISY